MIIPAILQTSFEEIKKEIRAVEKVAELIHIDIADGKLVEGLTYLDVNAIDQIESEAKYELHLMTVDSINYLPEAPINVTKVIVQIESSDALATIDKAKSLGLDTGVSISPKSPNNLLEPFITQVDFVQFMTVEPGKQGNPFVAEVLTKIKDFKQKYPETIIQVDGHMNKQHIIEIEKLGVDHYVVGSDIFSNACPTCEKLDLEKLID